MDYTVSFDEKVLGWTSFHSFIPEWLVRLNNNFYSIKEGQLYRHNSTAVNRGNFYGVNYPSKISISVNQDPSDVKVFKALGLEGTQSWDAILKAFQSDNDEFSQSTLADTEFVQKEGKWYAYTRRNEITTDISSKATYGIGVVTSITSNNVTFVGGNTSLVVGDMIYKEDQTLIGEVVSINNNVITLNTTGSLVVTDYIYGMKNSRSEGSELRGYTLRVDLETDATDKRELFAVNTEFFRSLR